MQGRHVRMLAKHLLGNAKGLVLTAQIFPQALGGGKVLHIQLFDTPAAVGVHRLGHDGVLARQKPGEALQIAAAQIVRLAAHELPELLGKGVLVVENVGIGPVVDPLDKGGGADAGQKRGALGGAGLIEAEHHIIGGAGAVAGGTVEHIGKHRGLGFSADGAGLASQLGRAPQQMAAAHGGANEGRELHSICLQT